MGQILPRHTRMCTHTVMDIHIYKHIEMKTFALSLRRLADTHMHTFKISVSNSSPPLVSLLHCSSPGYIQSKTPDASAPSNPLFFNNRLGQAGGSTRSLSVFYQSQTTVHHSPWLKVHGSCSFHHSVLSSSGIDGLCLSDKTWSMMVTCAACTYLPRV